jgi:HNH endonuclease
MATRKQDQRRWARMRANGPVESFTVAEIGERDGWVCGVCMDPVRLVELPPELVKLDIEVLVAEPVPPGEDVEVWEAPIRRRPLSASIDHILSIAGGGTHTRTNVQITHLFCNLEKSSSSRKTGFHRPEHVRAVLSNLLGNTPVPEELHRGCFASWAYPAKPNVERMIALYIAAGRWPPTPLWGRSFPS